MYTVCTYTCDIKVEWDANKATTNREKHGIDFADAYSVLEDDLAITIADEEHPESRFVSLGLDCKARLVVVIYTLRDEHVRLISARSATKNEQRQYGEQR